MYITFVLHTSNYIVTNDTKFIISLTYGWRYSVLLFLADQLYKLCCFILLLNISVAVSTLILKLYSNIL